MKYTGPEKECYLMFGSMPISTRKGIMKTYKTNGRDHAAKVICDLIGIEDDDDPKRSKAYVEYVVDAIINMCDDEGLILEQYRNQFDDIKIKIGDEFVLTDEHIKASKNIWQQTAKHMIDIYQNSDGISLYYHSLEALKKLPFLKVDDEEKQNVITSIETIINMFEKDGTVKPYYKLLDSSKIVLN